MSMRPVAAQFWDSLPVTWRPWKWLRINGHLVRDYWSVVPLVALAAILLTAGYKSSIEDNSLIAVGWGFAGGALVRGVDIAQERSRAKAKAKEDRLKDLDETRRLLYMALHVKEVRDRPELLATIVNAVAHHGLGTDPDEASRALRLSNRPWMQERIDLINAQIARDTTT